jgi:hypothetical protein
MRAELLLCALLLSAPLVRAQEKKDDAKKDAPRVTLIAPLGVNAGATATARVRGLKLADATEVKFPDAKTPITVTIKSKGKADLPPGAEAADAGDTQVEVELTVPKETPAGELPLVVVTPAGQTTPRALLVTDPATTIDEKEGNNGFRQAQALKPPATVRGRIENPDDVDVFSFTARSGQTVVAEVSAARYGSLLDSLLTLYDARGNVLASNDDATPDADATGDDDGDRKKDPEKALAARARRDSVLKFRCPSDGTYYLSLLDANARGGAAHVYQLTVRLSDENPAK